MSKSLGMKRVVIAWALAFLFNPEKPCLLFLKSRFDRLEIMIL